MRVYHGTPLGGTRIDVARFASGRHCLIPFLRPEDLPVVAEACTGFCFDNSAYTAWKQGNAIEDWGPYYKWCKQWSRHPGFDFALIPDVIDGSEQDNADLIKIWDKKMWHPHYVQGVPVWHMHESLERLQRLSERFRYVALGSSGDYPTPGLPKWWDRMADAMEVVCDDQGLPRCKLHGLRMAAADITARIPFASVDSTNVAQNKSSGRPYPCPTSIQRAELIAGRMESQLGAKSWTVPSKQQELFVLEESDA